MTDNPYSAPTDQSESPKSRGRSTGNVLRVILRYVLCYILGIASCVLVTPVELELAGLILWPFYILFAAIGFLLFYFYLPSGYLPFGGTGASYWLLYSVGFIPIAFEVVAYLSRLPGIRACRPLWIAFPIGFVGTLGVYYTAAASI